MELVPSSVLEGLRAVQGLERGRCKAKESQPVLPVSVNDVLRTLPFLRPRVRALVELQRLCGARPRELLALRRVDLDTSSDPWRYEPAMHETAYKGRSRVIFFGRRAQAILRPFLAGLSAADFDFSPVRDGEALLAERRANRAGCEEAQPGNWLGAVGYCLLSSYSSLMIDRARKHRQINQPQGRSLWRAIHRIGPRPRIAISKATACAVKAMTSLVLSFASNTGAFPISRIACGGMAARMYGISKASKMARAHE